MLGRYFLHPLGPSQMKMIICRLTALAGPGSGPASPPGLVSSLISTVTTNTQDSRRRQPHPLCAADDI
eukprot:scaffold271_cov112-Isochrysis_galbana.AAC.2